MKKNWYKKNELSISYSIGILGLIFAFFAYFFPIERQGKLNFILNDTTNIFAIKKPIKELEVYIGNRNLRKDSLDLKLFKFRLLNNRVKSILPDYFDQRIPFGLKLQSGKIISVKVAESNSKYLITNILSRYDSTSIILAPIIFQKKDFVDFEVLITHKTNRIPQFQATGKISGVKDITILNQIGKVNEFSWRRTLLVIGMTIGLFVFFYLLVLAINFLDKTIQKLRFNKLIHDYRIQHADIPDITLELCKIYSVIGKKQFIRTAELSLNDHELREEYRLLEELDRSIKNLERLKKEQKVYYDSININSKLPFFITSLEKLNCIDKANDSIKLDDHLINELNILLKLLQ